MDQMRKNHQNQLENIRRTKQNEKQAVLERLKSNAEKTRREKEERFLKNEKECKQEAERKMSDLKVNFISLTEVLLTIKASP